MPAGAGAWSGNGCIVPPLVLPKSPHAGIVPEGPVSPQSGSGSNFSDMSSEVDESASPSAGAVPDRLGITADSTDAQADEAETKTIQAPSAIEKKTEEVDTRVGTWPELQAQVHSLAEALRGLQQIRI